MTVESDNDRAAERPERANGLTTRTLLIAALGLTVLVLALTVAVVVVRAQPEKDPTTMAGRDLRWWSTAVERNPDAAWAQTGFGQARLEAGNEAGARSSFEKALDIDPDDWAAGFRLGSLITDSDPDRAEHLLEHAAEVAATGDKVLPYLALGDLRLDTGDTAGARTAYESAVADAPFITDARIGLARALEAAGDTAGALEQYKEAARYDPYDQDVAAAVARLEQGAAQPGAAPGAPSPSSTSTAPAATSTP